MDTVSENFRICGLPRDSIKKDTLTAQQYPFLTVLSASNLLIIFYLYPTSQKSIKAWQNISTVFI